MTKRRKLTKKERALLWYTADGKCQMCGDPLPDVWHADHVVPFVISKKTNVHEMQALCPKCNLRKGDRMTLRQHQQDMMSICKEILTSSKDMQITKIICDVTPGGGKSALPIILAHKLIPLKFDKICWVVPRSSLRQQGEEAFIDQFFRKPFILGHINTIRQSVNDINPSRGLSGFITTYQAIAQDPRLLSQEFDRFNYILFLDEPHHIRKNSILERALIPSVNRAGLIVLASGTLERHDKEQIAFVDYRQTTNGLIPNLEDLDHQRIIKYPRRVALSEKAILPLEFIPSDGMAEWVNRDGEAQSVDSFYDDDADIKAALKTVLETSFALQLIDKTVEHWRGHKKFVFLYAKLLVVSPNIRVAKIYVDHLKSLGVNCAIVHSKQDDKNVQRTIKRFKKGSLDALVTVAIAYEGLDVPEITHVACLTHYRSFPWLAQCFARSVRISGEKERGFIFTPDDPDINRVIEALRLEQLGLAKEVSEKGENGKENGDNDIIDGIIPQGSLLTQSRAIAPNEEDNVTSEQYKRIEQAMRKNGVIGISIPLFQKVMIEAGYLPLENSAKLGDLSAPLVTPTEQENNLKESIDTYTKKVDRVYFNLTWGSTNKQLYRIFKKPRQEMTTEELQGVWRFLQINYPMEQTEYESPNA